MPNIPPSFYTFFSEGRSHQNRKKWRRKALDCEDYSPVFTWFLPPPLLTLSFMAVCLLLLLFLHKGLPQTAGAEPKTRGGRVQLDCLKAQKREKVNDWLFRIVTPAPLYKANLTYLFSAGQKNKATPSHCSTQTASETLLDWVCLCCKLHSLLSSSPRHVSLLLLYKAFKTEATSSILKPVYQLHGF